jgi:hypothetical protein
MPIYAARANIDHYVGILNSDIPLNAEKRVTIVKLLIAELDKLSHDLGHLEFAESRAANGRQRLNDVKQLRDDAGAESHANAQQLVANVEAIQELLESFCHHLRAKVTSRS